MPLVERFEDGGEDRGVFAAGGADCDAFAGVEEVICEDGFVGFGFEGGEEAGFAEFLAVFGADDEGAGGVAELAGGGGHGLWWL